MPQHRVIIETRPCGKGVPTLVWVASVIKGPDDALGLGGYGDSPQEAFADACSVVREIFPRRTFDFLHVEH